MTETGRSLKHKNFLLLTSYPSLKVPQASPLPRTERSSRPCPEAPNATLVRATESMSPRRAVYVDWIHRCACSDIGSACRIKSLTPLCACTAVDEKCCTDNVVQASRWALSFRNPLFQKVSIAAVQMAWRFSPEMRRSLSLCCTSGLEVDLGATMLSGESPGRDATVYTSPSRTSARSVKP